MKMDLPDFDPKQLKQKYVAERDRRLRKDGNDQYRPVFVDRPEMLEDFDKTPFTREPVREEVDALVVGAGMSGIMTAGALHKAGVASLRVLEAAGDFGGTWYWNRYPGAQCDTEAYVYMPWLEETDYVPTEKYVRQPELFAYFQRLGRHFQLYERTFFRTRAASFTWDEATDRWIVTTDRGDEILARFVCLSTGTLANPKLPDVPGISDFRGRTFLTSRWDYDYTGGSPEKPDLTKLKDKRVAIVGTGCTAIQAVPWLARWAKELLVFQRTPSMINERNNRPTDPEWAKGLKPGWQKDRVRNFEICISDPSKAETDMVADGWTSLSRTLMDFDRVKPLVEQGLASAEEVPQLADYVAMEQNRARVASLVNDPATAEGLKPWYNVHCKRPTFHDEYLPAFNEPNVRLVDTGGFGIERLTEKGIVTNGAEHEVDCIIFSTGYEYLQLFHRTGQFTVTGVDGRSLADKWSGAFQSLHGVFTHGFPNMAFVGQIRHSAGSFNASYPFSLQAAHVGEVVGGFVRDGITRFEATTDAENRWSKVMKDKEPVLGTFYADCTPGHLNNEGDTTQPALRTVLYGGGILEYEDILETWRKTAVETDLQLEKA